MLAETIEAWWPAIDVPHDRTHERRDRGHQPVDQLKRARRAASETGKLPAAGAVALYPPHPGDCQ